MLALRWIMIPVGEFYRSLLHVLHAFCVIDSLDDSPRICTASLYSLFRSPGLVKLSSVIKNVVRMCNVKLQTSFHVQMITA